MESNASVALVSIIGHTPGSIDLIFLRLGGWLEEGCFRWSAPLLIQGGHYDSHLRFGFRRLEDKRLGRLIQFFCGSLGVTRGRFLPVISTASYQRWPLWPPSWICFPSIIWWTPVDWSDFLVPHWGSSIFTMFHFSLTLSSIHPQTTSQLGAYATPCVACFFVMRFCQSHIWCWSSTRLTL
jgi:hypothetical protein